MFGRKKKKMQEMGTLRMPKRAESAWDDGMKKIDHMDLCHQMMRHSRDVVEEMREKRAKYGPEFYRMVSEIKRDDSKYPMRYTFYDASLIGNCTEVLRELMEEDVPIGNSDLFYATSKTISTHKIKRLELAYFKQLDALGYRMDFREDDAEYGASYVMSHVKSVEEMEYFMDQGMPVDIALREYLKSDTYHRKEIIQDLLDNFADVNYMPKSYSLPPLYYALSHESVAAVDALVEAGANVDILDDNKYTLLMILVSDNMADAIPWLMKHKPKLDVRNGKGDNLLMMAIYDRDGLKDRQKRAGVMEQPRNIENQDVVIEILDELLFAGCDPYEKTSEGWTLVEYAKRNRMFKTAEHLETWMSLHPEPQEASAAQVAPIAPLAPDVSFEPTVETQEKNMRTIVEELKSLKELVELGILSQDEFDQKKKLMLGI